MPLVLLIVGLLSCALLLRRFLLLVTVSGGSMDPTLQEGDRVLVVRGWPAPLRRRGGIVVLEPWAAPDAAPLPIPASTLYIKRVIGLAGDTVVTTLDELQPGLQVELRAEHDGAGRRTWHIPSGHCFVRGDYPLRGSDSLGWGPVAVERVHGWVLMRLARGGASPLLPPTSLPPGESHCSPANPPHHSPPKPSTVWR